MRRILQSDIVHFLVGKNRKHFSIHQALEGSFPRKALEPAMIEGVDEEVFGRCCEFVYSGDYSAPSPIPESSGSDSSQPKDMETQCQKEAKRWDPSNITWNLFCPESLSLNYDMLLGKLGQTQRPEFEKDFSNDPFTSYAAVFLSHAEIHHVGVRTGWVSLIVLSLYRLLQLLEKFTLFEERTGDIVQLLEFVFEDSEYMESLEDMLQDYIVWNVEMMMRNADFKSFLERNSSLEQTVFRSMWK
ncbi:hypothetical protein N7523_002115 [Penicillium sp. IBT 18751x]|nr:hypothetical protein N7523_008354 [Penicillium sp. IBT 18751x]KAJ6126503.1 hypothetical protein N7523_002115 [Penicillium sp. IBT 18751x]